VSFPCSLLRRKGDSLLTEGFGIEVQAHTQAYSALQTSTSSVDDTAFADSVERMSDDPQPAPSTTWQTNPLG
jgi:hypothetical protein